MAYRAPSPVSFYAKGTSANIGVMASLRALWISGVLMPGSLSPPHRVVQQPLSRVLQGHRVQVAVHCEGTFASRNSRQWNARLLLPLHDPPHDRTDRLMRDAQVTSHGP
jgi:hypothetical protein